MNRIRSLSAGIAIGATVFLGGCVAPGPYYSAGGYPYYVDPVVVSPSVYVGGGCCWGNYWGWGGGYWGRPAYWGGYYGRPGYYGAYRGGYYGGYYGRPGYHGGGGVYARGGGYYGGGRGGGGGGRR